MRTRRKLSWTQRVTTPVDSNHQPRPPTTFHSPRTTDGESLGTTGPPRLRTVLTPGARRSEAQDGCLTDKGTRGNKMKTRSQRLRSLVVQLRHPGRMSCHHGGVSVPFLRSSHTWSASRHTPVEGPHLPLPPRLSLLVLDWPCPRPRPDTTVQV